MSAEAWDALAIACGTDKASSRQGAIAHGYVAHYHRLLASRPPRRMLEVGIERGDSLRFWAQVFPEAQIVGVDSNPNYCHHEMPSNVREVCADAERLGTWISEGGPLDLIIDDGSHQIEHIAAALGALAPLLAREGLYVVEDTVGTLAAEWYWPARTGDAIAAVLDAGLRVLEVAPSLYPFAAHGVEHGPQAMVVAAW